MTVAPSGPPAVRARSGPRRALSLLALLTLLLVGVGGTVSGCGTGCTGTTLQVQPVEVGDTHAPLTVGARLTRDGRPLAGVRIKLAVTLVGEDNAQTEALFYADTDADGRATVTRQEGVAGLSFPNERVTGYAAYFQPLSPLNGVTYCWSSAAAPITCRDGGSAGPCPRSDLSPTPTPTSS